MLYAKYYWREFTQTLQSTMHWRASIMGEQQVVLPHEETGQTERSQWVLDSPNPPPLWKKLLSSVKETIFPHGNKFCFSSKKKTLHGHAVSFFKSLFPIISWLREYKASKFKDDLLAGLTLASLCIPQVFTNIHYFCLQNEGMRNWNKLLLFFLPPDFSHHSSIFHLNVAEHWIC